MKIINFYYSDYWGPEIVWSSCYRKIIGVDFTHLYIKSKGPILRVTSSETCSICVKQALNTRRWLVNELVTWHVSYKITTLPLPNSDRMDWSVNIWGGGEDSYVSSGSNSPARCLLNFFLWQYGYCSDAENFFFI